MAIRDESLKMQLEGIHTIKTNGLLDPKYDLLRLENVIQNTFYHLKRKILKLKISLIFDNQMTSIVMSTNCGVPRMHHYRTRDLVSKMASPRSYKCDFNKWLSDYGKTARDRPNPDEIY